MKTIPVWDIWVRLFHWCLVACIALLFYSGKTGELFFDWHKTAGEIVVALIVFRILWGVVGSSNAQFKALLRSPVDAVRHLAALTRGQVDQERGHNAAGSWAVLALIALTTIQGVTGLFASDEDELIEGHFHEWVSDATADTIMRIHYINADVLLIVIILHIAAAIVYAVRGGQNLVFPMITGRMKWRSAEAAPALRITHWSVGLICAAVAASVFTFGFRI